MNNHGIATRNNASEVLELEESVANDLIQKQLLPDRDDTQAIIWPGHIPEDLAALDLNEQVERIMATSPGFGGFSEYNSDSVTQLDKPSHDLAADLYTRFGKSVFDLEYGHAPREDFSEPDHALTREEKIDKIRRLGETSNLFLDDDGIAVYNLNGMENPIVNEYRHDSFSNEDYQEGHAALFKDILEGEYFESVEWTDDISGRNYSDYMHFVIAYDPLLEEDECADIANTRLENMDSRLEL